MKKQHNSSTQTEKLRDKKESLSVCASGEENFSELQWTRLSQWRDREETVWCHWEGAAERPRVWRRGCPLQAQSNVAQSGSVRVQWWGKDRGKIQLYSTIYSVLSRGNFQHHLSENLVLWFRQITFDLIKLFVMIEFRKAHWEEKCKVTVYTIY